MATRDATMPAEARPIDLSPDDPALFIDRDLSYLRFQQRVLEEAQDERHPLLERVKFVAIVGTNIDDFLASRGATLDGDGARQIVIEEVLTTLLRDAHLYWRRRLRRRLREAGVDVVDYAHLTCAERDRASAQFVASIRPVLRPQAWPPDGEPVPLQSMGLTLVVYGAGPDGETQPRYFVRIPDDASALLCLERGDASGSAPSRDGARGDGRFVWVEEVVRAHLRDLFPDVPAPTAFACRVLRRADLSSPAEGDVWTPRHVLNALRRSGAHPVVVLVAERGAPPAVVSTVALALGVSAANLRLAPRVFDFRRLWDVYRVARPDLRSPERSPRLPRRLVGHADLFAAIREGDILLHHPFDAFEPVIGLVRSAAADPAVSEIAMSLYRTDRHSAIVAALCAGARRGALVRVLVELRARFDEERNARAAVALAEAGAEVYHSPPGVKVHAKVLVVTRREGDRLRRYAHVSSGNYNAFTARAYTDVALLTCHEAITADLQALFDLLMGRPSSPQLSHVLAAPAALRANVLALIEREVAHACRGRLGRVILKMNALVDRDVILALYRASRAGVQIDLLVRGSCCLRPLLEGVSDHIRVRSIVGQYLEHSRIWYFHNGGEDEVFVGSADLMPRNLDRRVEVMVPVLDPTVRAELQSWLEAYLQDNVKARELRPDGSYVRVRVEPDEPAFECQAALFLQG